MAITIDSLGGRKFVLTVICVAVGTIVEVATQRGVTAQFASLLAAMVAAFGAANTFNTNQFLKSQVGNSEQATPDTGSPQPPPGPSFKDLQVIHENMSLLVDKVNEATQTAMKAAELATGASNQIEQVSKLAKVAIKVNQGT